MLQRSRTAVIWHNLAAWWVPGFDTKGTDISSTISNNVERMTNKISSQSKKWNRSRTIKACGFGSHKEFCKTNNIKICIKYIGNRPWISPETWKLRMHEMMHLTLSGTVARFLISMCYPCRALAVLDTIYQLKKQNMQRR